MASITSPDYPGERLIVCRNPRSGARAHPQARGPADSHRARSRAHRRRGPARPQAAARRGQDRAQGRRRRSTSHKMAKHFETNHRRGDRSPSVARPRRSAEEAALDGIYVVRTNLPAEVPRRRGTVGAYKSLARVERAFRSLKTVDLQVSADLPLASPRVRAHVFLCMLAYYVEQNMRARLAPMLYDETIAKPPPTCATASSPRPSVRQPPSQRNHRPHRRRPAGAQLPQPARRSRHLLRACRSTTALNANYVFTVYSRPTPTQQRAFELFGVKPDRTQ